MHKVYDNSVCNTSKLETTQVTIEYINKSSCTDIMENLESWQWNDCINKQKTNKKLKDILLVDNKRIYVVWLYLKSKLCLYTQ